MKRTSSRWPSMASSRKVAMMERNWPTTGVALPDSGSTMVEKPRPMALAIDSPAMKAAE
ncbi:hypothetical protein HNP60_000254 [Sphingobium sp. B1D3A]|uniref:Uncharacterized protein n=1 Tax=Sphingobium lignivorans TaxID=2735886 RepID=A0ABR6NAH6_9SPHN|nr:hypothetical protein [Sphingobium lignivorans]